ncbi:MAG: ribosomal subunit interface protein [Candidatus Kerfeldbacteria bacterium CG08_land_8_20_14_0_20_42_7]|uniref:Ribosomal subunit interface protein n=1 Tax=Candidatus Kerfeldbacteria bacterium CG08_land_8_20_14_0_20_42_7 TaxID=2014245 RepID=A0A2H0YUZ1_9BACT|nr:MAG: ribosomal subunit interface protein [Candidatus Kerfeldbacteria bacterium CG08_land_8_20_14_0_20_42_7]
MNVIITGKNFAPSKANKDFVQKKLESLLRYDDRLFQVCVELDADKKERNNTKFRVEIWIEGDAHLQAGSQGKDFYSSVEMTVKKLKIQLAKFKEKRESKKKSQKPT